MVKCRSLLLVDDDENDRILTLKALEKSGAAVDVAIACDGVEALDYLYRRTPHPKAKYQRPMIVLMDLKMPRMDGFEVLRHVKADPQLRSIPIVIFTSSSQMADVVECYRLGANAYVVKPLTFRDFMKTVWMIGTFWTRTSLLP